MNILNPARVAEALERMNGGDASSEVLEILVMAAEAYANMKLEWGFEAPQPTLFYSTRNELLASTMSAGNPEMPVLARVAPDWAPE